MQLEYVKSGKFASPKIRLMRDKDGNLFVRKNVKLPSELAEKLLKISSPYIVKFVEFGEDDDGFFSIEEFIEGVSASEKALPKKRALKALIQLCEALRLLHRENVIHRDIKPSNIIIADDGNIRLIDFDAARTEKFIQDKDTKILGTEGFAPPEQFGFSQTDKRSDIYSFGVTMKVLLGDNCSGFESIIKKCTSFDPQFRYRDIGQVESAIRLAMFRRAGFIPIFAAVSAGAAVVVLTSFSAFLERSVSAEAHGSQAYSDSRSVPVSESLPTASESSSAYSEIHSDSHSTVSEMSSSSTTSSHTVSENSEVPKSSETSKSTESSVSSRSSSSVSNQSSSSSEKTQSSSSTHSSQSEQSSSSSSSVSVSSTSEVSKDPEPYVLHTSDMDNPNKIKFYTEKNSQGFYEDKCDRYIFYDDPTVHGEWKVVGSLFKKDLADWAAGRKFMFPEDDCWLKSIKLNAGGTAESSNIHLPQYWTNGYFISITGEGQVIMEMFTLTTANGSEYLLVENKNGDYRNDLSADAYFIYTRQGG